MMCLFLLFLGLKLGEVGAVKDWDWIWVTAPLWGFAVVWSVLFGAICMIVGFAAWLNRS